MMSAGGSTLPSVRPEPSHAGRQGPRLAQKFANHLLGDGFHKIYLSISKDRLGVNPPLRPYLPRRYVYGAFIASRRRRNAVYLKNIRGKRVTLLRKGLG